MIIIRILRFLVLIVFIGAASWAGGLILFVDHVRGLDVSNTDPALEATDAIVVLTGGSERVRTGLELLKQGRGKKLFISGVHPGLTLERVLGNFEIDPALRQCCIVLGHAAESTEGNAEETQTWFALEQFHSLRLVTANYHMPRSLLLFQKFLPGTVIIPHPITPESVILDDWWTHAGTANLLINEYNKFLFAHVSLSMRAL